MLICNVLLSKGPKQASEKSRAERKKYGCTNQAFLGSRRHQYAPINVFFNEDKNGCTNQAFFGNIRHQHAPM